MAVKTYTVPAIKSAAFAALSIGMMIGSATLLVRGFTEGGPSSPAPGIAVTSEGGSGSGDITVNTPAVPKATEGKTELDIIVTPGTATGGAATATIVNTVPVEIKINNESSARVTVKNGGPSYSGPSSSTQNKVWTPAPSESGSQNTDQSPAPVPVPLPEAQPVPVAETPASEPPATESLAEPTVPSESGKGPVTVPASSNEASETVSGAASAMENPSSSGTE